MSHSMNSPILRFCWAAALSLAGRTLVDSTSVRCDRLWISRGWTARFLLGRDRREVFLSSWTQTRCGWKKRCCRDWILSWIFQSFGGLLCLRFQRYSRFRFNFLCFDRWATVSHQGVVLFPCFFPTSQTPLLLSDFLPLRSISFVALLFALLLSLNACDLVNGSSCIVFSWRRIQSLLFFCFWGHWDRIRWWSCLFHWRACLRWFPRRRRVPNGVELWEAQLYKAVPFRHNSFSFSSYGDSSSCLSIGSLKFLWWLYRYSSAPASMSLRTLLFGHFRLEIATRRSSRSRGSPCRDRKSRLRPGWTGIANGLWRIRSCECSFGFRPISPSSRSTNPFCPSTEKRLRSEGVDGSVGLFLWSFSPACSSLPVAVHSVDSFTPRAFIFAQQAVVE